MKTSTPAAFRSPLFMVLTLASSIVFGQDADQYTVASPDETIQLFVATGADIRYSILVDGSPVVESSPISMTIADGLILGKNPVVSVVTRDAVAREIRPALPEKFAVIPDRFNELTMEFQGDYSLVFRVFDSGAAYRLETRIPDQVDVQFEQVSFDFPPGSEVYYPEEESFFSHNERTYIHLGLDTMSAGRLASLPVLVATPGPKVLLAESGLRDYPGLWLQTGLDGVLQGVFPHYPLASEPEPDSDRNVPVTEEADFIARTVGERAFPWRIMAVARDDADLLTNQLVYQLAGASEIEDPSWIQPGKVAWDWWNANNVYGVDFESGVNTETYKYYIDFASEFGIEYVILDEGWYELGDVLSVVPEMHVQELIAYGQQKGVGILLWVLWKTLDDQMEEALDQYAQWGVSGIKVDFMQRDDQAMVNFYWKLAAEAARRNLLVDYHGAYKPAGLRRSYPNVITREGVKGLEWNKWSEDITPTHNLTLPFTRMVPGPMDYTPGATQNAQPDNFNVVFSRPMSMGTRAHQVAMYVVYESPLQMLADSPSNYLRERETTEFIVRIPTTWHETRALEGSVGEYLVLARRHGDLWYVGAMTNENPRSFTVDLDFLGSGQWNAEMYSDGVNASRAAIDYKITTDVVSSDMSLPIKMAPGGGWVAILSPRK